MSDKIQRVNFTSEATNFLREMEKDSSKNSSAARAEEEKKYLRVNKLRDDATASEAAQTIWSGF